MRSVVALAALTFRDLLRRRVFVILGLFAGLLVLLSFPLRELTIGQWARLITDVGFGATELSATLVAIFLGATLIAGDLDKRTLYPLLAKPVSRVHFVLGKFAGLAMVAVLLTTTMALGTASMLFLARQHLAGASLLQVASMVALQACLCGSIVILFSCFTSSTLAATFALPIVFLGHMLENLSFFAHRSHTALAKLVLAAAQVLPNLEKLNLKTLAARQQAIPWTDFFARVGYGAAYIVALVALGAAIFSRRDLK